MLPTAPLAPWKFVPFSLRADASSGGGWMCPENAVETQRQDTIVRWDPSFLWILGSLLRALQSHLGAALSPKVTLPCAAWGTWHFLSHCGEEPWQPEGECCDFQKREQEGEAKFVVGAFQLPASETFSSCFPLNSLQIAKTWQLFVTKGMEGHPWAVLLAKNPLFQS